MNKIRLLVGVAVVLLVFGLTARADNTACTGAIVLVPDGSAHTGNFTASQQRWYVFVAQDNRSYAAMIENNEFTDVMDFLGTQSGSVHSGDCAGASPGGITVVTPGRTEPFSDTGINEFGAGRYTFKNSTAGKIFFPFTNAGTGNGEFRIRIVETTLFSPRWSTFGGFETFWGFQNTTNTNLSVTLKIIKTDGSDAVPPVTFTVNANTVAFRDTRPADLNVANDLSGSVVVTHDGPPGAIQADAFITGTSVVSGGSVSINVPVKFEPRWTLSGSTFSK